MPINTPSVAPTTPSMAFSSTTSRKMSLRRLPIAPSVPNSLMRSKVLMFTLLATDSSTMNRMMSCSTPNCRW